MKRDPGDPQATEEAADAENAADRIGANLARLCEKLQDLQAYASSLGMFANDRELLTCAACGLQEDVTIDGHLITHDCKSPDATDCGLRFTELRSGLFACPNCGVQIPSVEGDFFRSQP